MTKEEFAKAMSFLGIAYNKEFTQEQVGVWYAFFKGTPYEDFKQAITRLITRSKFLPSIAEVKQEITAINSPQLQLDPDEEWIKVETAIRRYGYYRSDEAMKSLDPFTAKVVRNLGGFQRLCVSEDGDWDRKNFLRMFNDINNSNLNLLSLTEPQLTMTEIRRMAEIKQRKMILEVSDDNRRED